MAGQEQERVQKKCTSFLFLLRRRKNFGISEIMLSLFLTCISCQGFARPPSEFVYFVFQSKTVQNPRTHRALSGQQEKTTRTEGRSFSMHRSRTEQQIHHH